MSGRRESAGPGGERPPGAALAAPLSRRGLLAATLGLLAAGCRGTQARPPVSADSTLDDPQPATSVIVPWAVGGPSDLLLRLVAEYWPRVSPTPLAVRNVTGSGGTIGARVVYTARPDGKTLLAGHESLLTAYHLGLATFNWQDFEPIASLFFLPELVLVRADRSWRDVPELLEAARRRPEHITWAATFGSRSHFLPGEIMNRTGVRFKLVGYEGTASCLAALLAGEVDIAHAPLSALHEQGRPKKLRLLGSTGLERATTLPEVPTLREQGLDVSFALNLGLLAPKGTSPTTLARLEQAAERVLAEPELQQRAQDEAQAEVRFLPRAQYAEQFARQDAAVRVVAETMGLRA